MDRLHRRADRRVRLLQPRPQRRRSGAARDARRRDRGFSGRAAGRAVAHAGVHAERGRRRPRRWPARRGDRAVAPGAFPIQLSLTLLAGVVIGGLGSLMGAVWGAALLVLLPNWTNDLASSFSLSTNVAHNLPLAIYGLVLIGAMLAWPTGIQGGFRAIGGGPGRHLRRASAVGAATPRSAPATARRPGRRPQPADGDPSAAAQPASRPAPRRRRRASATRASPRARPIRGA